MHPDAEVASLVLHLNQIRGHSSIARDHPFFICVVSVYCPYVTRELGTDKMSFFFQICRELTRITKFCPYFIRILSVGGCVTGF